LLQEGFVFCRAANTYAVFVSLIMLQLNKILRLLPIIAILCFGWLMLRLTVPYLSFKTDVDFLLTKQGIIHIKVWRYAFYTHITTSLIVLLSGALQFIRPLTIKNPRWHRKAGKLYIVLILFFSGPSGFIMALYANGGWPARVSFAILALLWMTFTYISFKAILKGNLKKHIRFMIRSYAMTLAAITLRAYAFFLPALTHLHGKPAYILLAWASWVPNLIVAEILIRSAFMSNIARFGFTSRQELPEPGPAPAQEPGPLPS
jgi:uncharacterized membrane protein